MVMLKTIQIGVFFIGISCFQASHAKTILAPELAAINLAGQAINLADYRGKVVYLDFWASWCPPCAKAFPQLNQLYHELKIQGFEIIAVSVDQEKTDMTAFLKKHPVDFLIGWDKKGISPERYQVETMPTGYLIDKKGVLRSRFRGFNNGSEKIIKAKVKLLLAE